MTTLQSQSDGHSLQLDEVFSYDAHGLKSESYFDKIIIFGSLHLFSDLNSQLLRFVGALTNRGRVLIIHRPFRLNTLPFPAHVVDQLRRADLPLESLISTVQTLGLEFLWQVERNRVVTSRHKWLELVQRGAFSPREQDQQAHPNHTSTNLQPDGVHELLTIVLRYAGDSDIEFVDKMVFLTVWRAKKNPETVSTVKKSRNKVYTYGTLEMEVTAEVEELLTAKSQAQQKKWSLFD